jgi:hypothetical protein
MARFRQFTKRQLWQRFLVQKVPTFYMIVDKQLNKSGCCNNFQEQTFRKFRCCWITVCNVCRGGFFNLQSAVVMVMPSFLHQKVNERR